LLPILGIILDHILNEKIKEASIFLLKIFLIYIGAIILLSFISDSIYYSHGIISQINMALTGLFVGIGAGFGYVISKHIFESKMT